MAIPKGWLLISISLFAKQLKVVAPGNTATALTTHDESELTVL